MAKRKTREYTDKLLELLEDGMLDWETVCRECLQEMSEDDVADMCNYTGWLDELSDTDEEEN